MEEFEQYVRDNSQGASEYYYGMMSALCENQTEMSESRLCPSVGNVNTDNFSDIWQRMRAFRPCGRCRQYRKFMESPRPDIAAARAVMGL